MKPIKKLLAVNGNRVVVNFVTEKQFDEILASLIVTMPLKPKAVEYLRDLRQIPLLARDYRTEHVFERLNVHCDFIAVLRHDVHETVKRALEETLRFIVPIKRLIVPLHLARYYFASVN